MPTKTIPSQSSGCGDSSPSILLPSLLPQLLLTHESWVEVQAEVRPLLVQEGAGEIWDPPTPGFLVLGPGRGLSPQQGLVPVVWMRCGGLSAALSALGSATPLWSPALENRGGAPTLSCELPAPELSPLPSAQVPFPSESLGYAGASGLSLHSAFLSLPCDGDG